MVRSCLKAAALDDMILDTSSKSVLNRCKYEGRFRIYSHQYCLVLSLFANSETTSRPFATLVKKYLRWFVQWPRYSTVLNAVCALLIVAVVAPARASDDPTRPLDFAEQSGVEGPALVLNAVFLWSERPAAVINGQILNVGDEIHGATIVAIEAGQVRYKGTQSGVLKLYPEIMQSR